jgi:hypothetical protein
MSAGVEWGKEIFKYWDQGGVELYAVVAQLAQISSDLIEDILSDPFNSCPGVWAYEVSETFGQWVAPAMARHRSNFDVNLAKVKLGEVAWGFFKDNHPSLIDHAMPYITKHTGFEENFTQI